MPQGWPRASADRLASRVASGLEPQPELLEEVDGEDLRAARVIRNSSRAVTGVVVASDYLSGDLAERSRRMTTAYERVLQLRVLRQPLAGVYLILPHGHAADSGQLDMDGAMPCQTHHASRSAAIGRGARIGQGRYDQRIEHEGTDEFGSMIERFNSMAAELASGRRPPRTCRR